MTDKATITNAQVLRVFRLEKQENDPDPMRAGINMPAGAEIISLIPIPGGEIGVAVLCPAVATRVWHPLRVAVMDDPIELPLGRRLGKPLGVFPIDGRPTALIPELPWPTRPGAVQVN